MSQSIQLLQSDPNVEYYQVWQAEQELGYFWKQGDGWFWNLSLPDAVSQVPDRVPSCTLQVAQIVGEKFNLRHIIAIYVAQKFEERLEELSNV